MTEDRIISALVDEEDVQEQAIERSLRPINLSDFRGQPKARDQLEIFIQAANQRKEALDHVLVFGPPGLGKTTLAHISLLMNSARTCVRLPGQF